MSWRDRVLQWRGVGAPVLFGGFVYLIALVMFFPYDRIKEQVIALAAAQNLDLEVGSAGPTFGLGVKLRDLKVATRPTDGSKPTRFNIDVAKVTTSALAALSGSEAYSIDADAFGGQIEIDWRAAPKASGYNLEAHEIAMSDVPGIKETINLPLGGLLDLTIALDLPTNRYSAANGKIDWTCEDCAVGDGKAKLKVASNPMLAEGLTFPKMRLGTFKGAVVFDKGAGKLQGVHAQSADGEVFVEGELRLADPPGASRLDAYVRFKLSDAFVKRDEKFKLLLQIAELSGKRPDGFYGVRMIGPISNLSTQWAISSPFAGAGGSPSRPGRPGMGVPPPVPSRPLVRESYPPPNQGAMPGDRPSSPLPYGLPPASPPPAPAPEPPPPPPPEVVGAAPAPVPEPPPVGAPAPGPDARVPAAAPEKVVDPSTDPNANLPRYPISPVPADDT